MAREIGDDMKYLLLVSHASLAAGIEDALRMLLGEREFVLSCGMDEDTTPEAFRASLELILGAVSSDDEVILLSDLAGGSPLKNARAVLEQKGLTERTVVFGGANLPMAISAVMGIEDELALDAIRDAMLDDGAAAVREL